MKLLLGLFASAISCLTIYTISSLLLPTNTHSAEFECVDVADGTNRLRCKPIVIHGPDGNAEYSVIRMNGRIVQGDYERYLAILRTNRPLVDMLILDSEGGDVLEALKIGRLTRRLVISTSVPDRCWSACVFIFAGSPSPLTLARLNPEVPAELGVHKPTFEDRYFAGLTLEDAEKLYQQLYAGIGSYLQEMRVPEEVTKLMWDTPSNKLAFVRLTENRLWDGRFDENGVLWVVWPSGLADGEWYRRKCPPPADGSNDMSFREIVCQFSARQGERQRRWNSIVELKE